MTCRCSRPRSRHEHLHPFLDLADVTGIDPAAVVAAPQVHSVYVYEAPVRAWHWINALAISVLAVSGWFIGSPLPSMPGEASDHYVMGYFRFAHFAAGYVLAIGLVGRAYWALVGNHHARELFTLPITRAAYWREVMGHAGLVRLPAQTAQPVRGPQPDGAAGDVLRLPGAAVHDLHRLRAVQRRHFGVGSWPDRLFGG